MAAVTRVFNRRLASCIFVLFGLSRLIDGQQECRTAHSDENDWPRTISNYKVAYNISSGKNVQSCYEILENNNGPTKDEVTSKYKIGDVTVNRQGNYVLNADRTATIVYKDAPNDPLTTYAEMKPNGVILNYVCQGTEQSILVMYVNDKDLSKEADVEAAKLTTNPTDFKVNC